MLYAAEGMGYPGSLDDEYDAYDADQPSSDDDDAAAGGKQHWLLLHRCLQTLTCSAGTQHPHVACAVFCRF